VYLLDTNICTLVIRGRPNKLIDRLLAQPSDELGFSILTLSELAYLVAKSRTPAKSQQALELFLTAVQVLEYSAEAALLCGRLRADLERNGTSPSASDLMIAAQALTSGCTLVSNKPGQYRRIRGLDVENWAR